MFFRKASSHNNDHDCLTSLISLSKATSKAILAITNKILSFHTAWANCRLSANTKSAPEGAEYLLKLNFPIFYTCLFNHHRSWIRSIFNTCNSWIIRVGGITFDCYHIGEAVQGVISAKSCIDVNSYTLCIFRSIQNLS